MSACFRPGCTGNTAEHLKAGLTGVSQFTKTLE